MECRLAVDEDKDVLLILKIEEQEYYIHLRNGSGSYIPLSRLATYLDSGRSTIDGTTTIEGTVGGISFREVGVS